MSSRRPFDSCGLRRFRRLHDVDRRKSLVRQGRQGPPQLPKLTLDRAGWHRPMSSSAESFEAYLERDVEHDRHGGPPTPVGDVEQLTTAPLLDIGRVNQRQPPSLEPDVERRVQQRKRILAG